MSCALRHHGWVWARGAQEITNLDLESIVNDEVQDLANNRFKLVHVQVGRPQTSAPET